MNKPCFNTPIIIFILLYATGIQAQEIVASSGGNATGDGGSVSYTVGQAACTSQSSPSGTVAQGVQQPYETLVVTGSEETNGTDIVLSVYPNPTSGFLKLYVEHYKPDNLTFRLYDVNGLVILDSEIVNHETSIGTDYLPHGTYFLRITEYGNTIEIFKIIKN